MRQVPIARKNLFGERRRAVLGIAAVAVAFLLIIALDGIVAGATRQLTSYIDTSLATVFVAQPGVSNMHMATSALPLTEVAAVRAVPGVSWASPILYAPGTLTHGREQQVAYVVGYVPGAAGGPVSIVAGSRPGPGEIVLDERAADDLGVTVGARVRVLEREWRVSGLTSGLTNIANTVAFVAFLDFAEAGRLPGAASYILVGTEVEAGPVAARIAADTGLSALTRTEFSRQEARLAGDMSAQVLQIVTLAAFLIGLGVIALTLYAATLSRLREIGVVKALGATRRRLTGIVLTQALWTVLSAVAISLTLALVLAWVLGRTASGIPMAFAPEALVRVTVAGLVLGAVAAVAPIVKVWRIDPASVFRR